MVASLATLLALPVLINGLTSKHANTPVAAVPGGADIGDSLRAATQATGQPAAATQTTDTLAEQRSSLPRATSPTQPAVLDIAIPQTLPGTSARGLAAYRRIGGQHGRPGCTSPIIPLGTRTRVVNVDNGHELACIVVSNAPLGRNEVIAVDSSAYAQLGDPVQAPLPVFVTW